MNYWVVSNNREGSYADDDWDMKQILANKSYYLSEKERNRSSVSTGDVVYMRIFGESYLGKFIVEGSWIPDPEGEKKHGRKTGAFPMKDIVIWKRPLQQWLIIRDLSNQDVRSRLVRMNPDDSVKLETAHKVQERLGFGSADGEILFLEKNLEEAIKPNLSTIGLTLADEAIQQQFAMGPGVGRSDLICLDNNGDLVVLELKRGMASDEAVGQVLRYVGFVRESIASEGQKVKAAIVASDYDEHLRLASMAAGIKIYIARIA